MRVTRTHKIALSPTKAQEEILRQAVGTARFAYNWALEEWGRQYKAGEKPNEASLRRQLNAVKREQHPWMLLVPKSVPQQAIKNLGVAFQKFFKKESKYPVFKKKGTHDSARFDNGPDTFRFEGRQIRLPVVGWVKMRESLRFNGEPLSATVSRVADRWFVSVPVEIDIPDPARENQAAVGVDLGITTAATLSSGEKLAGPRALKANLERLRRFSRQHSRKVKGSNNRRKSALKLARIHARIANIRQDWCHKTTTRLVKEFSLVGIETLNVRGMLANERLARSISDIGMFEFKRQLRYKAVLCGSEIVEADRWFPSSKLCSECGAKATAMPLSVREWTCECGAVHDRDINAAKNLRGVALARASSARSNACGEESSGSGHPAVAKLSSLNQESVTMPCLGVN